MEERTNEDARKREPLRGGGHFQWNAGAWFGAQLGSTLWMALGSALLFARPDTHGLVPLACFAAANLSGTALWRARGRLAPYPAFQALLVVLGLAAVVALSSMTQGLEDAARYYRGLIVFPVLMLVFHFLERSARSRASEQ